MMTKPDKPGPETESGEIIAYSDRKDMAAQVMGDTAVSAELIIDAPTLEATYKGLAGLLLGSRTDERGDRIASLQAVDKTHISVTTASHRLPGDVNREEAIIEALANGNAVIGVADRETSVRVFPANNSAAAMLSSTSESLGLRERTDPNIVALLTPAYDLQRLAAYGEIPLLQALMTATVV